MASYVYDLAQLIHQQELAPVTIVAHSMGGNIALRYTGTYPETVSKLVSIEGMGPSPSQLARRAKTTAPQRMRGWIEHKRSLAARTPRKYASIEEAFARMQAENKHLTPEQARYLTVHGAAQNEDGTYSWKFDNYVRAFAPYGFSAAEITSLWREISCPTLLVHGADSWMSTPQNNGALEFFANAQTATIANAGHWVHHDRLQEFLAIVEPFLKS